MEPRELALGRFTLHPGSQLLLDGVPVAISPKALNILTALVDADGGLLTKDELIDRVWPGVPIEENTLQSHISALRKVLGENGSWIATVPGRGYRYGGPRPGGAALPAAREPAAPQPRDASPLPRSRRGRLMLRGALLAMTAVTVFAAWRLWPV